jgi:hypothetical protein
MQINFRCFLGGMATGAVLTGGACWWWYHSQPVTVKTITGPTKVVTVREKIYVKQKAKRYLPNRIKHNPHAHVVAGTTVHRRQVTAVVDTGTGVTSLYVQPRPFISFANRTTVSAYEGIFYVPTLGPRTDTRIEVTERLLRIGSLHVDAQGGYDTVGAGFAGVGLSYRFGG